MLANIRSKNVNNNASHRLAQTIMNDTENNKLISRSGPIYKV